MPTIKLTDRSLKALKAPESGRDDYWDKDTPGFGIRVSQSGRKTWVLMYRQGRRQRRLTLGAYPALGLADARQAAKDALQNVAHGGDPAEEKKRGRRAKTFGDLAELYLERHARPNKASVRYDERVIEVELKPAIGKLRAADVGRQDVLDILDRIKDRGAAIMANRTFEIMRRICNFGVERGILTASPCAGLKRPSPARSRDRVLSDQEIAAVWKAAGEEAEQPANAIRLLLLTAQRKNEILGMRWADVDLASGWWVIPPEMAKNRRAHRVPLSHPVLDILAECARKGDLVFGSTIKPGQPLTLHFPMLKRIQKRSSVTDFNYHDLRRTAATRMTGDLGVSRLVLAKVLNHTDRGVTSIYDRASYDREKRQALDAWGERLMEIVDGRDADTNVVPLQSSADSA